MGAAAALLGRIVDYAGLFPPAALPMERAVQNYRKYLGGEDAWMNHPGEQRRLSGGPGLLGGFVLAAARLEEFAAAFEKECCDEQQTPWTLSLVCAGETAEDVAAIEEFQQGAVFIGSLEVKAADARGAKEALERLPAARSRYVEFAPERAGEILPVLAEYGARAKIRMGGLTADSIPASDAVARFLQACARERVAWKATAGLHHAVRGVRSLTDAPGSPRAMMHGFVNLFLAGALAFFGAEEAAVVRTLEEQDAGAFRAEDEVIRWHSNTMIADQIEQARNEFAICFGSCSFTEPVDDVKAMGWV
ncbi:MAG: hypothetical protein WA891_08170 [Acidobacteriaceae bacterium]